MKLLKRLIIAFLSILIFNLTFCVDRVDAYKFYPWGAKNYYGITGKKYWLQDSGNQIPTNWQKKYIDDAMYQWNSSSQSSIYTPMSVSRTNNRSSAIMEFFFTHGGSPTGDAAATSVVGNTEFFWWDQYLGGYPSKHFSCALIWYGGQAWYGLNSTQKRAVFAHEIGHGVGLYHEQGGTIMNEYPTGINNYKPTRDDLLGVQHLYQ